MAMVVVCGIGLGTPHRVSAQGPGQGQGGGQNQFAPNFFNRQTQPLSPYLNLNRGGDPAVNYFYGVRPGLQSGGNIGGFGNGGLGNGPRQTFFPYAESAVQATPEEAAIAGPGIRPTGHPIGYGNTMGYYGGSTGSGMRGTGAVQGSGPGTARPGSTRR